MESWSAVRFEAPKSVSASDSHERPNSSGRIGTPLVKRKSDGVEEDNDGATRAPATKSERNSRACKACRALKVRCQRQDDTQQACARCRTMGVECILERCRRGRVPGSKNKAKGKPISLLAQPNIVRSPTGSGTSVRASTEGRNATAPSAEAMLSPLLEPTDASMAASFELDLPVESARQSPDAEDHHMQDGPHPLSLLSGIGSRLRRAPTNVSGNGSRQYASTRHIRLADEAGDMATKGDCVRAVQSAPLASSTSAGRSEEREPPGDVLVAPGWTKSQLEFASRRKRLYFKQRLSSIKRDLAPSLDPILRGYVDETTAEMLVAGFFRWLQPQVGIMDPALHTASYLRRHSALLFTAVLAASVQTCPQLPVHSLSVRLYTHVERLFLMTLSTNAKSPEIALSYLIMYLWPIFPERNVDDRSRIYLTLAINMGVELDFQRLTRDIEGDELARRRHRDCVRTWMALYIHDRSLSAFSGRPPLIKAHAAADEMRSWLADPLLCTPGDRMIVAYLELRAIENEARTRLGQVKQPYLSAALKQVTVSLLEAWSDEWCAPLRQTAPDFAHMMHFVSTHLALLILTKGTEARDTKASRDTMIALGRSSLEYFIANMAQGARYICRTVCAMISWGAVVYLKMAGEAARPLVRATGLALAPYGDRRMGLNAAHFYGSFLLEMSFDHEVQTVDSAASPLAGVANQPSIPSPSTLWVLENLGAAPALETFWPFADGYQPGRSQYSNQPATETSFGSFQQPASIDHLRESPTPASIDKQQGSTDYALGNALDPLCQRIGARSVGLLSQLDGTSLQNKAAIAKTNSGASTAARDFDKLLEAVESMSETAPRTAPWQDFQTFMDSMQLPSVSLPGGESTLDANLDLWHPDRHPPFDGSDIGGSGSNGAQTISSLDQVLNPMLQGTSEHSAEWHGMDESWSWLFAN